MRAEIRLQAENGNSANYKGYFDLPAREVTRDEVAAMLYAEFRGADNDPTLMKLHFDSAVYEADFFMAELKKRGGK